MKIAATLDSQSAITLQKNGSIIRFAKKPTGQEASMGTMK